MPASCPLCRAENETVLWQNSRLRVIAVNDTPAAPAFCRVIWRDHVAEMTDLPAAARQEMMAAVWRTEAAMRAVLNPDKINSIWAVPRREAVPELPEGWQRQVAELLAKEEETDGLV